MPVDGWMDKQNAIDTYTMEYYSAIEGENNYTFDNVDSP